MIQSVKLFAVAFAISAASLIFTSCEQSDIKGEKGGSIQGSEYHGQDINSNDPALSPDTKDTAMSGDTGTTGGINSMDPEGSRKIDKREDSMNAGSGK